MLGSVFLLGLSRVRVRIEHCMSVEQKVTLSNRKKLAKPQSKNAPHTE
jgi:hypothetical protein